MKRLLWIGDAAVPSGFSRATHGVLDVLRHEYDITVLGMNYRGDPHEYPYPIYVAAAGGDYMGVGRLLWMCDYVKPDVIVIQQDVWNIPQYITQLRSAPEYKDVPVIGFLAVDGKNCAGYALKGLSLAIFWTQFGLDEARKGGWTGPSAVIPLGVDTTMFYPMDKTAARRSKRLTTILGFQDIFIVGCVNRNQPRKRWDLLIKYFATWVKDYKIDDAFLYLHTAPTGDTGCEVPQLMTYYGVLPHLLLVNPPVWYGPTDDSMRETYNCFDVAATTTQGEGMGLTTLEAMACGVPVIAPDWSALGEWGKDAMLLVPCTSTIVGAPYVNVIGGIPDEELFIKALDNLYSSRAEQKRWSALALARAEEDRFRWSTVGRRVSEEIGKVLNTVPLVAANG